MISHLFHLIDIDSGVGGRMVLEIVYQSQCSSWEVFG
jgi:hypothetical protein